MEVPVQPASDQPADQAPRRQRNRELNHRFGLDQLAERAFAAGLPCSIVRHSSTITPRMGDAGTRVCITAVFVCLYTYLVSDIQPKEPLVYESEFEKNLYQQRREKLEQIAAIGQANGLTYAEATYPNSYSATYTIPELRAAYDSMTAEELEAAPSPINVSIAGRIMAIRVQGKAGFAQLQQGGQRFQIYVRKDDVGEDAFALYKLLDLGDHIGVRGHLFRTRTGELTVHVAKVGDKPSITFLAKAMLALPDKYHGLEDTELRYRQRYVDLFMNTGATKAAEKPAAPP